MDKQEENMECLAVFTVSCWFMVVAIRFYETAQAVPVKIKQKL